MVEQKLIRRELETSRFPVPSASEVEPILEKFKSEHYPNPGDMARSLADYGITEQDLVDELLWQRTLLQFIEIRFRPGIQITNRRDPDIFRPGGFTGGPRRTPRTACGTRRFSRARSKPLSPASAWTRKWTPG